MASKYDNGNTRKKIVKTNRSKSSLWYDKNGTKKKLEAARKHNHQPKEIKKRDSRNKAATMVSTGPNEEVDHKNGNPEDNSPRNIRRMSIKKNRQLANAKPETRKQILSGTHHIKSRKAAKKSRQAALRKAYKLK